MVRPREPSNLESRTEAVDLQRAPMHNYLSVERLSTSEGALSSLLQHFGNTNV